MKDSQSGAFQELWMFLQVQSQKTSATMKLAPMRTATRKEDPVLPLLQRISSLKLQASEIAAQINASEFKEQTHLNINCSEETVWIRPSWLNCCIEITTKGHKQKEETCLGQETWAMDIRPVEICPLVWWVHIWDFWGQLPCLSETQSRWTYDLRMCGSHREAWRRRCDGVRVLWWWHCLWFI